MNHKHLYAEGLKTIKISEDEYDIDINDNFRLFKYAPPKEQVLDNIINDNVYLGNSLNFNDPFDTIGLYDYDMLTEIVSQITTKHFSTNDVPRDIVEKFFQDQKIKELESELKTHLMKLYRVSRLISCFSSSYMQPTMWSHYSDDYSGIVLEYSAVELLNALEFYIFIEVRKAIPDFPTEQFKRFVVMKPIYYTDDIVDFTEEMKKGLEYYIENENFQNMSYFDPKIALDDKNYFKQLESLYYSKSTDWSYENEWRITIPNIYLYNEYGIIDESAGATIKCRPESVTIGFKMSEHNKKLYINECYRKNIDIYLIKPNYSVKGERLERVLISDEELEQYLY